MGGGGPPPPPGGAGGHPMFFEGAADVVWGGVGAAPPRPGRAKFALHPRHVLRTCLTGTHQAARQDE